MASRALVTLTGASSIDLNMFKLRATLTIPPEIELYVGVVRWHDPLGPAPTPLGAPATRVRRQARYRDNGLETGLACTAIPPHCASIALSLPPALLPPRGSALFCRSRLSALRT
jgi:hypothetical protein